MGCVIASMMLTASVYTQAMSSQEQFAPGYANDHSALRLDQSTAEATVAAGAADSAQKSANPIKVALGGDPTSRPLRLAVKSNGQYRPPSEPKEWMLVALGLFLIVAISHRRISALES